MDKIKEEYLSIFITNLRLLRKLNGISQTQLGHLLGKTRDSIRHIEKTGYVSSKDLIQIAEVFGIEQPAHLILRRLEVKLGEQTIKL